MPVYKTSKEEILKKSFKVFLEKGYYHTSVSDLSKACGIEKPHFYYYFKNKQDLMMSVLRYIRVWAKKNMFIHAYNENLSGRERMNELLMTLKEVHQKSYMGCIFSNTALETANNDATFVPLLQDYFNEWREVLKIIFLTKYDVSKAEELSHRFFNELHGVLLMVKVHKDFSYMDRFIENQLQLL
jgi:TetR/AcrR family transcriptional regulator, transcriptional repressor for nem operon